MSVHSKQECQTGSNQLAYYYSSLVLASFDTDDGAWSTTYLGPCQLAYSRQKRSSEIVTLLALGEMLAEAFWIWSNCIGLSRCIAITTLAIIAVFLEYLRQFLIDLHQIHRHSSVPKTMSSSTFPCKLSNGVTFDDLEWPLTRVSRSR